MTELVADIGRSGARRRAGAARAYPLSSGQQRLWFLDRFEPGDPAFNIPFLLRLNGTLQMQELRRALDTIVDRHEVLRACFPDQAGLPVQVIRPGVASLIVHELVSELRGVPVDQWQAVACARAEELSRVPFDLQHGPLLRADLLRLTDDDHVLLVNVHHIVFDAWSIGVFYAELTELYTAYVTNAEPRLPDLPAQYPEFALWQQQRLQGEPLERQLNYWRDHLAGTPALLTLPTDRPRPRVQTSHGARYEFTIPGSLLATLRRLSASSQATMFMTMLAAFQALLALHSGQDDVVVGTPIAARNDKRWEPLIGFFVNTIALRTSVAGNPSFRELITRAREATLGGLAHSDVPFERLVEALQPDRSLGHSPIFQAQMIMHTARRADLELPGLRVTGLPLDPGTAQVDLTLFAGSRKYPEQLCLDYNTDLFDRATMERFAEQYVMLLAAVAADPDRRVKDVPMLSGLSRWELVVGCNDTEIELPSVDCPSQLVAGKPAATAVRCVDRRLSYEELVEESDRLARLLTELGVAPDVLVGLCLPRSTALVGSMLGVWKAGGGYVPLDPDWPVERLRLMVEDAELGIVITERAVRERLPELFDGVERVVFLEDVPDRLAALSSVTPPTGPPEPTANADHLAYVIYTSGSTGRPKGVAVSRRSVINLLVSFANLLDVTDSDVLAAVTTLSFDISVLELLLPLLVGGQVLVITEDEVADGPALARRLRASGATVMQATPAGWRLLLAAGGVPAGVRLRLCGGEAFPRDLAGALGSDGAEVWNVYGPTETTVWSAAGPVQRGAGPVLLGPPIGNTQLYVLNHALEPVPVGVVGELYIGGHGLARGYHRRPELTERRFVPDPFADGVQLSGSSLRSSAGPGRRLYATGDLARYHRDGAIEFLGRADQQVKVRGFRVELGEIEAALHAHEHVHEAVVTTWSGRDGDTRLVGYLVPTDPAATAAELATTLRPWLVQRLPDYMVPAAFVVLPTLPLTANGKTDRAALPEPDWGQQQHAEHIPPGDAVQTVLARLCQELLDVPVVGATDDFFRLGGHSLLAAQLLARVREYLDVEVPIRRLFEAPTVAGLAAVLAELEPTPGHVASIAELRCEVDAMSAEQVDALLGE